MIGIYRFTNKINGKAYIGQSKNIKRRIYTHYQNAFNKNKDTHFYNALRKYGKEAFIIDILIECSLEELDYYEKYYIKLFNSNNKEYGYNMNDGGGGQQNMTEDSRKKQKEKLKGKKSWNSGLKGIYSKESLESNRQKHLGKQSPHKGQITINDGKTNKYISIDELDLYLNNGWIRGGHKLPKRDKAWNSGLTKYTDERVAKYGITRKENKDRGAKNI